MEQSVPYIHPQCVGAPNSKVPKGKYAIPMPHIPSAVAIDGSLVGRFYELGFSNHDFYYENKFSNFKPHYYMNSTVVELNQPLVMQFQQWALVLQTLGITNLLDIPHFGKSTYITCCVKTLPSCVHGGHQWLNPPVFIDANSSIG